MSTLEGRAEVVSGHRVRGKVSSQGDRDHDLPYSRSGMRRREDGLVYRRAGDGKRRSAAASTGAEKILVLPEEAGYVQAWKPG